MEATGTVHGAVTATASSHATSSEGAATTWETFSRVWTSNKKLAGSAAQSLAAKALQVVSLSLGGENTNPVEFEMKGDNSEMAAQAIGVLRKANKAVRSAAEGPLLMPASEMRVVQQILALIFEDSHDEQWHSRIQQLLGNETWGAVISTIRGANPHLFDALSLPTLQLDRPTVWENPSTCKRFTCAGEYLTAWKQWYNGLDRTSQFWREVAPRRAREVGLEVPVAFAGLLLFDLMCLSTARCAMGNKDDLDGFLEDTRGVPFKELARFAAILPASSIAARHVCAKKFTDGAHAVLAQEVRSFADYPPILQEFLPPFRALDGATAVFLRKDSFSKVTDITSAVLKRMEEVVDGEAAAGAWRANANRLVVVWCQCHARLGGFQACFASLHAYESDFQAELLESLRDALADYGADIHIVGMDSNVSGQDTAMFQKRLWNAGFEIGCSPKQQQVTVARQRTIFQTRIQKVGDLDISHKDYIVSWTAPRVSWTSPRVRRVRTRYTPDLRTSYGVEQETKQCVRLPTTQWPFDHCGVATSFKQTSRCKDNVRCSRQCCWSCCVLSFLLLVFASPLASTTRSNPYQPGTWYLDSRASNRRRSICEATMMPCLEGWLPHGGSCYITTPMMPYPDGRRLCEESSAALITIGSEAENQLVVWSLCPRGEFCYIGLQESHSGALSWASGEEYNYTQLVEVGESALPIIELDRGTGYLGSVVASVPAELDGCDVRSSHPLGSELGREQSTFTDVDNVGTPVLVSTVSGTILALPRPRQQRLASGILSLNFCANILWASSLVYHSCFVDNIHTKLFTLGLADSAAFGGQTLATLLSLWMIVKRMSMLYPTRALKSMYWALLACFMLLYVTFPAFVYGTDPLPLTWAVILCFCLLVLIIMLYVVISVLVSRDLYRTWNSLRQELTNGCNDHVTSLARTVRAAKIHFFAVCFAIITGALRWAAFMSTLIMLTRPTIPDWCHFVFSFALTSDSVTNDLCVHFLACMNVDAVVVRAKCITTAAAERAEREVEQHRLAVRMLKAAPTSIEQLHQFAALEKKARAALGTDDEKTAFMILKSAISVESARVHKLMYCVRVRAMTMGLRYQYLIDVPGLDDGAPRQLVPDAFAGEESEEAAGRYFTWLYGEASAAQQVLFHRLKHLLAKFNSTDWPSDLGLAPEEFPWRIWASNQEHSDGTKRLQKDAVISPGEILVHDPSKTDFLSHAPCTTCILLEETSPDSVSVHCSGMPSEQRVPRDELRSCHGGGVFIPGPQKKTSRCMDKVTADYAGSVPWPAAASLVDICRCTVLCDDPYAVAVFVAYLRKNMNVVRLKNRFNEDVVESRGPEDLQSMFAAISDSTASESHTCSGSTHASAGDQQYRDISVNVAVKTPNGHPFVCEIQVTLSNLSILKHADTKLYTIRRMKSPAGLVQAHVYDVDR